MLPIILRTTRSCADGPASLQEAALALGLPQWKVVLHVVLPTRGQDHHRRDGGRRRIAGETRRSVTASQPLLAPPPRRAIAALRCRSFRTRSRRSTTGTASVGRRARPDLPGAGDEPSRRLATKGLYNRRGPMADGIRITRLNAWFGPRQVLRDIDLAVSSRRDGDHRPVRLREVDLRRCINRMHEVVRRAGGGRVELNGEDPHAPARIRRGPAADRMVFQKPNPFPTMSTSTTSRRASGSPECGPGRAPRGRGAGAPPRRPLGRGQGRARKVGRGTLRRTAAATLHSPGRWPSSPKCS